MTYEVKTFTDEEGSNVEVLVSSDDDVTANFVEVEAVRLAMALRAHDEGAFELWLTLGDAFLDRTVMQRLLS